MEKLVGYVPLAGIAVGIYYKVKFYKQGYGLSDVESGSPVTAQTGEQIWSFEARGRAVSEPTASDGVVYVSDSSHEFPRGPRHLYALDAQTGQELWTFEAVSTFLPAPPLGEDTIYVTTTGEVCALQRK